MTLRCRLLQILYGYLFVVGGFVGYGLLFFTYPLRWIGLGFLHAQLTRTVCFLHWALLLAMAQWGSDIEVNIFADPDVMERLGKEKVVAVMNHKYHLDWLSTWIILFHYGVLPDFKSMVKRAILWIPIIGWAMWFSGTIFVRRDFKTDKQEITKSLEELSTSSRNYWLHLFCEGTRVTPEKHKASVEYALANGLEPLQHHLMPRTKGFTMVRKALDGKVFALYDTTVMSPGGEALPLSTFVSGAHARIDILIRRIPFDEVPYEEEKSAAYLLDLYRYKDRLCEYYLQNQRFPLDSEPELQNYVEQNINIRQKSLLVTLTWIAILIPPLIYFLVTVVFVEMSIHTLVWIAAIGFSGVFLYHYMLRSGSVSSSYGKKNA